MALPRTAGLGAVGDAPQTILSTEGVIHGTFDDEPAVGSHLGFGVFHRGVSYHGGTAVNVEMFQAAPGDINGNRQIDNIDMLMILAANSFNNGTGFDWTKGDFDGDMDVDNSDLALVLGHGLFGTGPYAAAVPGTNDEGVVDLGSAYTHDGTPGIVGAGPLVVPEPCAWVLLASGGAGLLLWRRWRNAA